MKLCELCGEQVEPADPEVVEAVQLVEALTFGPKRELLEVQHVFFHRRHYPAGLGQYRLIEQPER